MAWEEVDPTQLSQAPAEGHWVDVDPSELISGADANSTGSFSWSDAGVNLLKALGQGGVDVAEMAARSGPIGNIAQIQDLGSALSQMGLDLGLSNYVPQGVNDFIQALPSPSRVLSEGVDAARQLIGQPTPQTGLERYADAAARFVPASAVFGPGAIVPGLFAGAGGEAAKDVGAPELVGQLAGGLLPASLRNLAGRVGRGVEPLIDLFRKTALERATPPSENFLRMATEKSGLPFLEPQPARLVEITTKLREPVLQAQEAASLRSADEIAAAQVRREAAMEAYKQAVTTEENARQATIRSLIEPELAGGTKAYDAALGKTQELTKGGLERLHKTATQAFAKIEGEGKSLIDTTNTLAAFDDAVASSTPYRGKNELELPKAITDWRKKFQTAVETTEEGAKGKLVTKIDYNNEINFDKARGLISELGKLSTKPTAEGAIAAKVLNALADDIKPQVSERTLGQYETASALWKRYVGWRTGLPGRIARAETAETIPDLIAKKITPAGMTTDYRNIARSNYLEELAAKQTSAARISYLRNNQRELERFFTPEEMGKLREVTQPSALKRPVAVSLATGGKTPYAGTSLEKIAKAPAEEGTLKAVLKDRRSAEAAVAQLDKQGLEQLQTATLFNLIKDPKASARTILDNSDAYSTVFKDKYDDILTIMKARPDTFPGVLRHLAWLATYGSAGFAGGAVNFGKNPALSFLAGGMAAVAGRLGFNRVLKVARTPEVYMEALQKLMRDPLIQDRLGQKITESSAKWLAPYVYTAFVSAAKHHGIWADIIKDEKGESSNGPTTGFANSAKAFFLDKGTPMAAKTPTPKAEVVAEPTAVTPTKKAIPLKQVVSAVIRAESAGKREAVSPKGAIGLMQVMPSTAAEVAKKLGMKDYNLKNEKDNTKIGTAYLMQMIDKFKNLELALAAYNAGPGFISKLMETTGADSFESLIPHLKKRGYHETVAYVPKVLRFLA